MATYKLNHSRPTIPTARFATPRRRIARTQQPTPRIVLATRSKAMVRSIASGRIEKTPHEPPRRHGPPDSPERLSPRRQSFGWGLSIIATAQSRDCTASYQTRTVFDPAALRPITLIVARAYAIAQLLLAITTARRRRSSSINWRKKCEKLCRSARTKPICVGHFSCPQITPINALCIKTRLQRYGALSNRGSDCWCRFPPSSQCRWCRSAIRPGRGNMLIVVK